MGNVNILVEKGKTTISNNKKGAEFSPLIKNKVSVLDQMQNNFDNINYNYNNTYNESNVKAQSSNFNINNIASLLPLISKMSNKNETLDMSSMLELISKCNLGGNNRFNFDNILQLLPLLQNLNTKKANTESEIKIDTLKSADEE